jgi:aryl-alcohol dehydrogenase-like predicted oxidoreductase
VGCIPWSPLARGILARPRPATEQRTTQRAQTDTFAHDMYEGQIDWEIVDAVHRVAQRRGVSAAQVALAWLLSRPGVTAPIVGASKPPQLQDAIAAVELELTSEEIAELETPYRPHKVLGH